MLPSATRHGEHSKGRKAGLQSCMKQGGNRPCSLNAGRDHSVSPCFDWNCRAATEEGRVGMKGLWILPPMAMKLADMVVAPVSQMFF